MRPRPSRRRATSAAPSRRSARPTAWPVVADERMRGREISLGAGAHGVAVIVGRRRRDHRTRRRRWRTSPTRSSRAAEPGHDSRHHRRTNALARRLLRIVTAGPPVDRLRRPLDVTVPASLDHLDLDITRPAPPARRRGPPAGCSDSAARTRPAPRRREARPRTSDEAARALHPVDHDQGRNGCARGEESRRQPGPCRRAGRVPDDHHRAGREVLPQRLAHPVQMGGVVGARRPPQRAQRGTKRPGPRRHACRRQQAEVLRRPGESVEQHDRADRRAWRVGLEERHRASMGRPLSSRAPPRRRSHPAGPRRP